MSNPWVKDHYSAAVRLDMAQRNEARTFPVMVRAKRRAGFLRRLWRKKR